MELKKYDTSLIQLATISQSCSPLFSPIISCLSILLSKKTVIQKKFLYLPCGHFSLLQPCKYFFFFTISTLVNRFSILYPSPQCTKQILSEKLGRGSRTVDLELEAQIEVLRDNKRKYEHVVKLAQTLCTQLAQMLQTQRNLGDAFADLSLKTPELHVSIRTI